MSGAENDPDEGTLLRVETLSIGYRTGRQLMPVLDSVDLRIGTGEAFGLIGESGSGKSTLAYAIMRYLPRNAEIMGGKITLAARDIASLSAAELGTVWGREVALVAQEPGAALNPSMSIGRQVIEAVVHLQNLTIAQARVVAQDLLASVAIRNPAELMARYPHQLSGGQQQRALIAMALAGNPHLLVLDEPTSGLDATVQAEVMDVIQGLRGSHRMSLLFISHNIALVGQICDTIGVMKSGKLVEVGKAQTLLNRPAHPYTAALLDCIPTLASNRRDNPVRSIANKEAVEAGSPQNEAKHAVESDSLLEVNGLTKTFGSVVACDDISFSIYAGETLGLVGESGSGKSTLANCIAGLVAPDRGTITLDGEELPFSLRRRSRQTHRDIQMVFQRPHLSLNPSQRIGAIIDRAVLKLADSWHSKTDRKAAVGRLLSRVQLPLALRSRFPGRLSGGQKQRVAIVRAFAGKPRLVLCDEPVSALDASVQAGVLNLLADLQDSQGVSYLFISHDLIVTRYIADRVAVMYLGQLMEIGPCRDVFDAVRHPYTDLLLRSLPEFRDRTATASIAQPAMTGVSSTTGCRFTARCPHAMPQCRDEPAPWREPSPGHQIRCHLPLEKLRAISAPSRALARDDGEPAALAIHSSP